MAKIINHAVQMLAIILSVFFIGYFLELYRGTSTLHGYYFEILTELLPLVMSFSIFVMTWHAYTKNRDNNALFLGAAFLIIGLFDLYHLLSLPFMPGFITQNSPQKAAVFWSIARVISAGLFLASAYVYRDSLTRLINKSVLFASVNVSAVALLNAVLLFQGFLPAMHKSDGSFSGAWLFIVFLTSAVMLYASYLYSRRQRETGQKNITCLLYGFIIIVLGNMVYYSYEYSGHLLRAAGYYFVYIALFKSSIEQPYEKLVLVQDKLRYAAEERYRNLFDNANDAIITIDLKDSITSWNRSAEIMFGWKAEEVIGKKLSGLIVPPDLLAERNQTIQSILSGRVFTGIDAVRMRKDGTRIDVSLTISPLRDENHDITGLSAVIRDITERKRAEEEMKKRLMKFRLNEGMLYLVKEPLPTLSLEAFKDLLKVGYRGLVISRTPEEEFKGIDEESVEFLWLAEREGEKNIFPDLRKIENRIGSLPRREVILIDGLDYLVFKNGFTGTLSFVHNLRELAYLSGYVILLCIDTATVSNQELRLLEKETKEVEPSYRGGLSGDMLDVLRYIYGRNSLGIKPSHSDVGQEIKMSKPTVRKKVRHLVYTGYAVEIVKGRNKVLELTEKGRREFLK